MIIKGKIGMNKSEVQRRVIVFTSSTCPWCEKVKVGDKILYGKYVGCLASEGWGPKKGKNIRDGFVNLTKG